MGELPMAPPPTLFPAVLVARVPRSTWVDPSCTQGCIPLRILQVEAPFKLAVAGDHAFGSSSGSLVTR